MENYIALLLMIVPGFMARKIYKQTSNIREELGQFEETLYCLFYSLFISITVLWISGALYGDVATILTLFHGLPFITEYAVAATVVSVIMGISIKYLLAGYNHIINIIRNDKDGKIIISNTIYDNIFNNGKTHIVEVYKDGIFLGRGAIVNSVEKYKEFYLEDVEEGYREVTDAMGVSQLPYKGIYIDGRTGIVIKELDITL